MLNFVRRVKVIYECVNKHSGVGERKAWSTENGKLRRVEILCNPERFGNTLVPFRFPEATTPV
jgi:hypothetical protein